MSRLDLELELESRERRTDHRRMGDSEELGFLSALDRVLRAPAAAGEIAAVVSRVRRHLSDHPASALAWEPIPLSAYGPGLPAEIRSSWVFILRANTETGAERHPNSVQRMVSWDGAGDFQTRRGGAWESHLLTSDLSAPLERRWITIPVDVWHQGVVPPRDWVVVSFHTAAEEDLIEERDAGSAVEGRVYAGRHAR
jgi:hypothetical protein